MLHYVRARSAWKACIHMITRMSGSDLYLHQQRRASVFIHPLLPGRNDSAQWKHCWQDDCVCSLNSTADTIRLICGVSSWVHPHHTLPLRATSAGKILEMPISSHLQVPKFIQTVSDESASQSNTQEKIVCSRSKAQCQQAGAYQSRC